MIAGMGRSRVLIAVAVVMVVTAGSLLVWRGLGGGPTGSSTSAGTPGGTTPAGGGTGSAQATQPATGPALKPLMLGLIDRQGLPSREYLSSVDGLVVNVNWSDLQPSAAGPIADGTVVDATLAQVRALNRERTGQPLGIKLRVYAGIHAPDWAKQLGGAPITVTDPTDGVTGMVGRFWSAEFGSAYADFETRLAARYDGVPELREVTISRCTTVYAEPFIRDRNDTTTVAALRAAGYTEDADLRCLREQIDAHQVWRTTRSGLAVNPYQRIDTSARGTAGDTVTEAMMVYCRKQLGGRCVLENNSLRYPPLGGAYSTMYTEIARLGPPITFQTATSARVGDLAATVDLAARLGGDAVELPAGYAGLTPGALQPLRARLLASSAAVAGAG